MNQKEKSTWIAGRILPSRYTVTFGIGFLIGVIFSAVFGYLSTEPVRLLHNVLPASGVAIVFIFAAHIIERYFRHVRGKEDFFEFLTDK
jgi:uncharacterized BrkB/YihY/UPF0761 family membrane protein